MTELLDIYRTLKSKTWVDLTHQINEKSRIFLRYQLSKRKPYLLIRMASLSNNLRLWGSMEPILILRFIL